MQPQPSMEMVLRELNHPAHSDQLKNQQQVTFKLVKTGEYANCFIEKKKILYRIFVKEFAQ